MIPVMTPAVRVVAKLATHAPPVTIVPLSVTTVLPQLLASELVSALDTSVCTSRITNTTAARPIRIAAYWPNFLNAHDTAMPTSTLPPGIPGVSDTGGGGGGGGGGVPPAGGGGGGGGGVEPSSGAPG
ncbi:unannotated protein [freshwater metagenome]|uniref:Unannotated protein n=1 Tax=freshwater metagenome TaxID=449393 RepID=A0A6J7L1Q3_9ZZZZ